VAKYEPQDHRLQKIFFEKVVIGGRYFLEVAQKLLHVFARTVDGLGTFVEKLLRYVRLIDEIAESGQGRVQEQGEDVSFRLRFIFLGDRRHKA